MEMERSYGGLPSGKLEYGNQRISTNAFNPK